MKRTLTAITAILLAAIILAGCSAPPAQNGSDITASPEAAVSPEPTAAPEPTDIISPSADITPDKLSGDMKVLSDKTTLGTLSGYLKMNIPEVLEKFKNQKINRMVCGEFEYYDLADTGITLFSYGEEAVKFSYIECDKGHVSIEEITNWGFSDIQKVFGQKEVKQLERGLPGLNTYYLYYQSGDAGVVFQDTNADGSNAHMLIVDKFDPKYGYIDITAVQVDSYFKMSKDEILKKLGKGRDDEGDLDYADFGVTFSFLGDDSIEQILFDDNYQIEGVRSGMLFKDVMKILGQKKLKITPTTEDGNIYYLEYKYDTFTLRYDSFNQDGSEGTIYIFSNKVKFEDLYV